MNSRKIILLAVALIVAGGTMLLARSMLDNGAPPPSTDQGAVAVATAMTEVLVAARDLPAGSLLKDTDVKWQAWPKDAATEQFAVKGVKETKDFIGAVVRQGLRTGDPIMNSRVVRVGEQGFLSAVLTPGLRAITIPITPASGVAGFAFPGDHVDVIVTHKITRRAPEGNGTVDHKVSETMLTNVRVLALDQKTDDQAKEAKPAQLATLEVTPRQAEKLALVVELGTLSLALRSIASDPEMGKESAGYTLDSDVSASMPKPANRNGILQRVQIMRGKETTETLFDGQ